MMKIGIIGPGAIGLLFAYYLQKESITVTIYTRTENQAANIRKQGITCIIKDVKYTVYPNAMSLCEASIQDDYVFVAVKQYHLQSVLPYLYNARGTLVFLQNGMAHLALLQKFTQVAVGIVDHGARKENDTTIIHTGVGTTKLGIVNGEKELFQPLISIFTDVFPLVLEEDWYETIVNKLVVNACVNPLTALYKVKNGELIHNESFKHVMKTVCMEVLYILDKKNQEDHWQRVCSVCEKTAENRSSMLADVMNDRLTEIEAIVGYLVNKANEHNQHAPLLSFLYHSIKGMEHIR